MPNTTDRRKPIEVRQRDCEHGLSNYLCGGCNNLCTASLDLSIDDSHEIEYGEGTFGSNEVYPLRAPKHVSLANFAPMKHKLSNPYPGVRDPYRELSPEKAKPIQTQPPSPNKENLSGLQVLLSKLVTKPKVAMTTKVSPLKDKTSRIINLKP
jgi:hypothetical protein